MASRLSTKAFTLSFPFILRLAICLFTSTLACHTSSPQEEDDNIDNSNSSNGEWANENSNNGPVRRMPHPKEATAWDTRKLLLTNKLPPTDQLNNCQEELRALSSETGSQEDMIRLENNIRSAAIRNPNVYHWCFYRLVTLIDSSLEKDEGVMPREKMPRFFARMKGLWALARVLDKIYGTKLYFSYIRVRYMQISRDFFGRPLEVITAPLGESNSNRPKPQKKKDAGEFQEDDDDMEL